jgi:hypothetical protein
MAVQSRWYQISKSSSDPLQQARAVNHTRSSGAQDCQQRCSICIIARGPFPRGVEEVTVVVVIQPGPGLRKQVTLQLSHCVLSSFDRKENVYFPSHSNFMGSLASCVVRFQKPSFQRIEFHIDAGIYSDIDILSTGPSMLSPLLARSWHVPVGLGPF